MAHAFGTEVTVLSHTLKKQQDGKKMEPDRFIATSDPGELGSLEDFLDLYGIFKFGFESISEITGFRWDNGVCLHS